MRELTREDLVRIINDQNRIYGRALESFAFILRASGHSELAEAAIRIRDNYGLQPVEKIGEHYFLTRNIK